MFFFNESSFLKSLDEAATESAAFAALLATTGYLHAGLPPHATAVFAVGGQEHMSFLAHTAWLSTSQREAGGYLQPQKYIAHYRKHLKKQWFLPVSSFRMTSLGKCWCIHAIQHFLDISLKEITVILVFFEWNVHCYSENVRHLLISVVIFFKSKVLSTAKEKETVVRVTI